MLRKMRSRFILSAMGVFSLVMVVLAVGINLWSQALVTARLDETLTQLRDFEEHWMEDEGEDEELIVNFPGHIDPEADFTTRFFFMVFDESGNLVRGNTDYIHAMNIKEAQEYAAELLEGRRVRGYKGNYRYLMYEQDGNIHIVFLNAAMDLHFIRSLAVVSAVVVAVSLLVVLALIVRLSERAIRPYAENMERQKRFITDASHELKTPLTSISASLDVIMLDREEDEWTRNIRSQLARLSKLVGDLVTLSRLDEVRPLPEKREFDLSEAAWESTEAFARQALAAGKSYQEEIEERLLLRGDKASIQQLISILLGNAIQYSDEHGSIRFSLSRRHGRIEMQVENTFPAELQLDTRRLFDRFYRPDESRTAKTGGHGLGLAIAKAIVEGHGGTITADCPEPGRICFRVGL